MFGDKHDYVLVLIMTVMNYVDKLL